MKNIQGGGIMKKIYILSLYLLMLALVPMFFGADEIDIPPKPEVLKTNSVSIVPEEVIPGEMPCAPCRQLWWDVEDGWQGWTHTNGLVFPAAWDVQASGIHTPCPDPGDSSMWIDSDASGGGYSDTALSPVVVPPAIMACLKYGYYNYGGGGSYLTELRAGIKYFTGGVWNVVELAYYPAGVVSGPAWDSVDVSAYAASDSVQVYFYHSDLGTWGYYSAFDNVKLYSGWIDIGCLAVISPPSGKIPPGDYDVIGQILNFGSGFVTFDVTANIYDTTNSWNLIFSDTVTLTNFPVGGDTLVNFGNITFGENKVFYTEIYTIHSYDLNPWNDTSSVYSRTQLALGDVIFEMDVETPTGDNQCLGIEFDGSYFYVTGANSGSDPNKVYVLDTLGNLIWEMDQPAHSTSWGWRDFCWDGIHAGPDRIDTLYVLYMSHIDFFGINLEYGFLVYYGFFSVPGFSERTLAFMPDSQWFFSTSIDSVYRFSKTNPYDYQSTYSPWNIMGLAYDPGILGIEGPWIWCHSADDPGTGFYCHIEQFDPLIMAFTGLTFGYVPTIISSGSAGGLCFYEGFRGMDVLFALVYGDPVDIIVGLYVRDHVDVEEKPGETIPLTFRLAGNVPNPVRNGKATISYTTTRMGPVSLKIYDSSGRLVRTLIDRQNESPGYKTVYWDGLDNNYRTVAAGVYFLRLQAENKIATKKIVVVR